MTNKRKAHPDVATIGAGKDTATGVGAAVQRGVHDHLTTENNQAQEIPIMLTIREAARKSGLSYDAIRKLCLQGKIVFIRIGTKYLINWLRFCEFLNGGGEVDSQ